MTARVEGKNLREAGRSLGGVETPYQITGAARDLLFTKEKFTALPAPQRAILPMLAKPRSAGELIESGRVPWSRVLREMAFFLKEGLIAPAG